MHKKRLLWQLFPAYLLITLLALVAVTWDAWWFFQQTYRMQVERDLAARARLVQRLIADPLLTGNYGVVDALCKEEGRATATRITVILTNGQVVADSDQNPATLENHRNRPEIIQALASGLGSSQRRSNSLHKDMLYVAIPVRMANATIAVVRTSLPLTSVQQVLSLIAHRLLIGLLVIALVTAGVSLYISRRISQPLEEMKHIAVRFSRGDLSSRLPAQETEEISGLAEAMNHMAAQLDERIRTATRQRNEQEAMLLSMTEGILAVDNDENVLKLNQAAARLLGVNAEVAEGRSIQEAIRNSDLQRFIAKVLDSETMLEGEIILRAHGECFMQLHGTLLRDEYGRRIGAVVVMSDVTRLRKLETVRRDFVANVSHELKTPITSIKGFVETLLEGSTQDPEESKHFLEIIAKHTDRLNAIIEDLLSLSRLDQQAEKSEIALGNTVLRRVLTAAVQNCDLKAHEKRVRIVLHCDARLQAALNAPLLEQAVTNLIDNAIKYSEEESRINIEATEGDTEFSIRVSDEGCGIAPEHLPRLFERFYRVDNGRSRKLGGTGLGLAIVKHIVQAHKGNVTVESTPGQGSTFAIHIPNTLIASPE